MATPVNAQHRFKDADVIYREALAMVRALHEGAHSSVATGLSNQGSCLASQGKFADAQDAFDKAPALDLELFGEEHPSIAFDRRNFGSILQARGCVQPAA